ATIEEICDSFAAPDRDAVRDLLEELAQRRIVVGEDDPAGDLDHAEEPLEIFYWHFGETAKGVRDRIGEQRIAVVGINAISRQLLACLAASEITDVDLVDDPLLRNVRLFDGDGKLDVEWAVAAQSAEHWVPDDVGC